MKIVRNMVRENNILNSLAMSFWQEEREPVGLLTDDFV